MRYRMMGVALLLGGWLLASPAGFVIRVEGERIIINRGMMDSVKPGDRFVVMRAGKSVAELQVEDVGQRESKAVIAQQFSGEPVLAGDALSLSAPTTSEVVPNKPKALTPVSISGEEARQHYEDLLRGRVHSKEFVQQWSGKAGNPKPPLQDVESIVVLNSLIDVAYGAWWGPVDLLLQSANQAAANRYYRDHLSRDFAARIEIEVVHWDQELLEAYCRFQAAQNGVRSVEELNTLRNQMMREKGLDQNDVFQVRIRNSGELNVELSPFHWHMFTSAPNGKRVAATRYDPILDRKLTPKQEVMGYVTFPRVPDRDELTVYLEDIYGDQGEFSFSR